MCILMESLAHSLLSLSRRQSLYVQSPPFPGPRLDSCKLRFVSETICDTHNFRECRRLQAFVALRNREKVMAIFEKARSCVAYVHLCR